MRPFMYVNNAFVQQCYTEKKLKKKPWISLRIKFEL